MNLTLTPKQALVLIATLNAVISLMRDSNGTLPAVTVMDASLDPINIKSTLEGILSELVVGKA